MKCNIYRSKTSKLCYMSNPGLQQEVCVLSGIFKGIHLYGRKKKGRKAIGQSQLKQLKKNSKVI